MKRRIVYAFIIAILVGVIFSNNYLNIEYDMNLFEYFTKSSEITDAEQEWLDKHGKIIYTADRSSPPLRFIDETDGQFQGLIVDYIRSLSIEIGQVISIEPSIWWSESLDKLTTSESDFSDLIPSEKRAKFYDFSDPIYTLRETILIPKESEIRSQLDLKDKTVAVPQGDYAIEFLDSIPHLKSNINYVRTQDLENAIMLLKQRKVDAVVGDEPVINYFIEKLDMKDDFKILDKPIIEEEAVLAVKKGEKELLSILNKGIYQLKKKKVTEKVQEKWFGISVPFDKQKTSQEMGLVILIFLSLIFLILYLSYSWNMILKREVEKRTEELNSSKKKLQTTFDGLIHLMIVIDRDHNIENVNEAFCKLVQLEKNKIIGQNCLEFKDILYGSGVEYMIENTFYNGKPDQKEYKYKDKIFQMSTFPLEDNNREIRNLLIMIRDITQIIISEQQLLHESKMAAIGQLAAGIAHEIRNPLGLIRNYCYILNNNFDDENKRKKAINVIEASVERASDIIDNLLNFSRISSNEYEKVDIRSLITNIIALENKILEKNSIRIDVRCPEDIMCFVNEESLKHIFINLISNSIDVMTQGGLIKIVCKKNNNKIIITFCDNGAGISEENLDNIFNPFFTTKPIGKGTGLGLYIVYNEIQKHGGKIRVSSKLGKGTCFKIELPLRGEVEDETA